MNGPIAYRVVRLAALLGMLLLAACGSPTPYQPVLDGYGYSEQRLEENRFRVTFSGNSLTHRETVENYLLYRAAEVTLLTGNDHFVVVERDTERSTTYYSDFYGPSIFGGFSTYRSGVGFGGFSTGTSRPTDRYMAQAYIVVHPGPKPPDDPNAYDARAVMQNLSPKVVRDPLL